MYVSTSSGSRDNLLRAIRFEKPDYIPMTFHINAACWWSDADLWPLSGSSFGKRKSPDGCHDPVRGFLPMIR